MHNLEQSVIRILNTQGATVGTAFVVVDRLAVTCAHVVQVAGSTPDSPLHIQFYRDASNSLTSSRKDTHQSRVMMWPSCYLINCQKASLQ